MENKRWWEKKFVSGFDRFDVEGGWYCESESFSPSHNRGRQRGAVE